MKVCIVGFSFTKDRKEGAKNYVYNLSKQLTEKGYEVLIVTSGAKDQTYRIDGFTVIEVGIGGSLRDFIAGLGKLRASLKNIIKNEKPEIIYDHFVLPGTSLFVTVPLKLRHKRIRFIKEVYNRSVGLADVKKILFPFNMRFIMNEGIFRLLLNNVLGDKVVFRFFDRLIYHTRSIGRELSRADQRKSKEIPLGIDLGNWKKSTNLKRQKNTVISYLGHPSLKKGVNEFISASRVILEKYPQMTISMALSKSAEGEKYYYKKVKTLEEQFPVRVELVGEVKPLDFYSSSDILIFPLLHDWAAISPPLSLLEAMASSSIVMATKVNGMEDIIEDGRNGFLIERPTSNGIVMALEKYMGKINDTIREKAYKSMKEHDWKALIPLYEEIFKK